MSNCIFDIKSTHDGSHPKIVFNSKTRRTNKKIRNPNETTYIRFDHTYFSKGAFYPIQPGLLRFLRTWGKGTQTPDYQIDYYKTLKLNIFLSKIIRNTFRSVF